ncbi:MAG: YtxH domain-containing protein [Duncaniella sp.]|nr:YtxH domain-containing protein [Duncaniella sp.]
MSSNVALLYAFIGGAIVGAGASLLFAPEKGEDLRARVAAMLRKKGILCSDSEIDALVEQLTTQIDD